MKKFIVKTTYGNYTGCFFTNKKSLQIYYTCEDGYDEPLMTCAVNVKGLLPAEIAIKNYSENEGVLDTLIELGVVSAPHRVMQCGYTEVPICVIHEDTLDKYMVQT